MENPPFIDGFPIYKLVFVAEFQLPDVIHGGHQQFQHRELVIIPFNLSYIIVPLNPYHFRLG